MPFGYVLIDTSINSTCWRGGNALHFCVKYSPRCEGIVEMPHRPVVLDSYFGSKKKNFGGGDGGGDGGGSERGGSGNSGDSSSSSSMLQHLPMFGFPRGKKKKYFFADYFLEHSV